MTIAGTIPLKIRNKMKIRQKGLLLKLIVFALTLSNTRAQDMSLEYKDIVCDTVLPVSVKKLKDGYFTDFEKTLFGKLHLELNSSKKDTIYIYLGEKKTDKNKVDLNPPGSVRFLIDTVVLEKGINTILIEAPEFEPPGWAKNSNYFIPLPDRVGNVIPFRYAEIRGYSGKLEMNHIRQIAYFYPFSDSASDCKTSSVEINQIWELCKHTMKATGFCGIYVDGDRERRPYEADAYINQLSHYAVDSEYALARRTIDHLAAYPTWPNEWLFHMPMMLWEDYMYTGNKTYIEKYYHHYKELITALPVNKMGLVINTGKNDIIDWPAAERDGYELGNVNNVPNAFYYHSLILLAKMSEVLGYEDERIYLSEKAEKVKQAFNEVFWDVDAELYTDAIKNDHNSIHANIFPVVFGLSNEKQIDSLIPFVKSKGMATSVYGAQYLLDMLYLVKEPEYAFQLLTAHGERSWMNMIEQGTTITMEAWNAEVKPNLDWNHAWGAAPGNIIVRRVFGIRPLTPGFEIALIDPQIKSLNYGHIKHATIRGDIEFSFHKSGRNKLKLNIKAQMPVQFKIPIEYSEAKIIKLNNEIINAQIQDFQNFISLDKGENKIEIIL